VRPEADVQGPRDFRNAIFDGQIAAGQPWATQAVSPFAMHACALDSCCRAREDAASFSCSRRPMTNSGESLAYVEAPVVPGVRSRFVETATGLRMHLLEAGTPGAPVVLLLHGFPELAYSWRHHLPALAAAGYHAIAPDQRGYGRTTGWDGRFEADLAPYRLFHLARDVLALVRALGLADVSAVIRHDFGSFVAGCCATMRPDVFRAVVLMSAPFGGAPRLGAAPPLDVPAALAALDPPRVHYQWY
jgi:hypothetical protein